jgi:hypothetical protein
MPHLVIVQEYSHMGGKEILSVKYPDLMQKIIDILTTTQIPEASKISEEKTKPGEIVWSGNDFNKLLKKAFGSANWKKLRLNLEYGDFKGFIEGDFHKKRVGLEVQFGKYFAVDTDFMKFEIFHNKGMIDLCVEIVPSSELHKKMCTGPPHFNQVISRIQAKGRNNPAVPIWIIGVNVT